MTVHNPVQAYGWTGSAWVPILVDADGRPQVDVVAGGASTKRTFSWIVENPAVGGVLGPRIEQNMTVDRIDAYVLAATSVTFNIEERATIGSAGSNLLSSDLAADVDGASATSFADSALVEGNWLYVDISAVSGTPGQVVIVLSCTVD